MLPQNLQAGQFAGYPPEARKLAEANIAVLRRLPLSFLPSLLHELIDYDYKFPQERTTIDSQLAILSTLSQQQWDEWFAAFVKVSLSSNLERFDWINKPQQFLEQQSAYLWTTQQLDAFRGAATEYGDRLRDATTPASPDPLPRLGIAVIGQGVTSYEAPLFSYLRSHGTYFKNVQPENGLSFLIKAVESRALAHPLSYGHWYVDGGPPVEHSAPITCVSYAELAPVRAALLNHIQAQIRHSGTGPEELRTDLAQLLPAELGIPQAGDPVLDRFRVKLFTEGSGTQIFSTTFVQWTAREALRRAQPLTLFVRYAPRQRQRPMNDLLSNNSLSPELDPIGSLVDADMGAWYQWIDQQRLPGSERSSFVVWFEGHSQAMVVAPTLPRGAESSSPMDVEKLLSLALN